MPHTSVPHGPLGYILLTLLFLPMKPPGALFAQDATPNTLGQPLVDPSGEIPDDAFKGIPLRPEDLKYADLEGAHLKRLLLEIDAISHEDRDPENVFWGRNVGTWGHGATQDWVEEYFRNSGLIDVHREQFDLAPQWQPERWNISFSSGGENFSLEPDGPARAHYPVDHISLITSPEIKDTEQDTPDWIPAVGLEQIARAYARIIDGVNELEREEIEPPSFGRVADK